MLRILIILLLTAIASSKTSYRLYHQPSISPNFRNQNLLLKTITPDDSNLFITVYSPGQAKYITIYFYTIQFPNPPKQIFKVPSGKILILGIKLLGIYWVSNEYLLVIGADRTIFYRPPFSGVKQECIELKDADFNIASSFREENDKKFLIVTKIGQKWNFKRYLITFGQRTQISEHSTSLSILQIPLFTLTLRDYDCLYTYTSKKRSQSRDIIYCHDFVSSASIQFKVPLGQYQLIQQYSSQNQIYFALTTQIFKYCLQKKDGSATLRKERVVQSNQNEVIRHFAIKEGELLIKIGDCQNYFVILKQGNDSNYFRYQYIKTQKTYCDYPAIQARQNELIFIASEQEKNINKPFELIVTSYIKEQVHYTFIMGCMIVFGIIFLTLTVVSASQCNLYAMVLRVTRQHTTLPLEVLFIFVLHLALFMEAIALSNSANSKFTPTATRSTSVDSFPLKTLNFFFFYTLLISTVFEIIVQNKAKRQYLNALLKQGLRLRGYFCIRAHFFLTRSLSFAAISIMVFYAIDNSFSQKPLQLNPSFLQLSVLVFGYWAAMSSGWAFANICVYVCRPLWGSLELFFITAFLAASVSGQFYLNKSYTAEQQFFTLLFPFALFPAITQHLFRVQPRFDESVSTFFLFGSLIAQTIVYFIGFIMLSSWHYSRTSLQKVIKVKMNIQILQGQKEGIINSSVSERLGESVSNEEKSCQLLKVFIPIKLNANGGVQRISVLKNVRFQGRRGEIISFLDYSHSAKAMLLSIVMNDQQSDFHVEEGIKGEISFMERVRIGCCLSQPLYFEELTVREHLQLFSYIRTPSLQCNQRQREIEFLLNEFNFPDEMRDRKAKALSGGFLKRLNLACAFVGNPDVVILDQPSLGLDIRFRAVLYRKLRQWRQNRLILVGTSDREEAEAISSRVYVIRKARLIDFVSQKHRRIVQLSLHFSSLAAFSRGSALIRSFAAGLMTVYEQECVKERERFKIRIEAHNIQKAIFSEKLRKLIEEIHSVFNLRSNECYLDFRIIEHPYDESSYIPYRKSQGKQLSSQQFEKYLKNNAIDLSSDEEFQPVNEDEEVVSYAKKKAIRLVHKLINQTHVNLLYYSQFRAHIYKQLCIWRERVMKKQFIITSTYFWLQNLLLTKFNRDLLPQDFLNLVVVYSFLHLSIADLRLTTNAKLSQQFVLIAGSHSSISSIARLSFDFIYIYASLLINILIRTVVVDIILESGSSSGLLPRAFCGCLYVFMYILFTALLTRFISRMTTFVIVSLLTHVAMMQCTLASFVVAYTESNFSVFFVLEYIFPPFTVSQIYNSLLFGGPIVVYDISIFLQALVLAVLLVIQWWRPVSHHMQLSNYTNVYNETINFQRQFQENSQDHNELPLIGDNLIHIQAGHPKLRNFYFHLKLGEIFGLLGHNGSGKSTIFKIVSGEIRQTSGTVVVLGTDKRMMRSRQRLLVGYCSQANALREELTLEQTLRFLGTLKGMQKREVTVFMVRMLRYFRLGGLERVTVGRLSEVEKRKLCVILTFIGTPKILLFDEATSGMEPQACRKSVALIRAYSQKRGAAVLLTTHRISDADNLCDRVSVLKDGVLCKGGIPIHLRGDAAHQFFLLTLNFNTMEGQIILQRRIAKAKNFIYGLNYYRVQLEERNKLIYSLDVRRIDPVSVWRTLYCDLFQGGIIEAFAFSRHGLREVVSFALSQSQAANRSTWLGDQIKGKP